MAGTRILRGNAKKEASRKNEEHAGRKDGKDWH